MLGLVSAPFLPTEPGAIEFLVAAVLLIVAVGLGVGGLVRGREGEPSALPGFALGLTGLIGLALFTIWVTAGEGNGSGVVEAQEIESPQVEAPLLEPSER